MRYIFILLLFFTFTALAGDVYPFQSAQKEKQFQHLLIQLRCVACQNESLNASNAKIAVDLRNQIYKMVQDNQSDSQIKHYLHDRYGNVVFLKPPFMTETYLLWLAPLLMLFSGIWLVVKLIEIR